MKIVLDDINYKGHHFEKVEVELHDVNDLEDVTEEEVVKGIVRFLDDVLKRKK